MLGGVWEEQRVRVPGGGGSGDHAEEQGGQVPGVLLEWPRAGVDPPGKGLWPVSLLPEAAQGRTMVLAYRDLLAAH